MAPKFARCEVQATFLADGRPRPTQITWLDRTYRVADIGRYWMEEDGQHLLVRLNGGPTLELWFHGVWDGHEVGSPPRYNV